MKRVSVTPVEAYLSAKPGKRLRAYAMAALGIQREAVVPDPADIKRVALNLARADGAHLGNRYAETAYRAGVDTAQNYWNDLALAALTPTLPPHTGEGRL